MRETANLLILKEPKLMIKNIIEKIKTFFVFIFLIVSLIWIVGFIIYGIPAIVGGWNEDRDNLPRKYDPRTNSWVDDIDSPLWPDYPPY